MTIPVDATQRSYAVAAVVGYRQGATSQTNDASYQLTLNVGNAGDGNGHDNADWGDAQLMCFG